MFSGAFFGLIAWLYYLCFFFLAALSLFIALQGRRVDGRYLKGECLPIDQCTHHRSRLRWIFLLLAFSLLLWQFTLFLEVRTALPATWLWLGRLNFTAIAFAPYFALRFVREVASRDSDTVSAWRRWLRLETVLLAGLMLLTPLVDAAERVDGGRAITTFGPLFPGYLAHVVGYLAAALVLALRERCRASSRMVRSQLTLIAGGMLATGGIAFLTNALLPYGYDDFRFCDIGTLSTLLFLLAIASATFLHRLFDLQVVLRKTLVYGILLAFVLGTYSSIIFVVSQYLTEGAGKLTQFAVLLIAFSFDPLRRFLEEKTDRWLFGQGKEDGMQKGRESQEIRNRDSKRRLPIALLFPWRH